MRRSSFTVYFEDGRVESLSREEIRAKLTAGELGNRDAVSIANGRPKQPGAFPAFADVAPPVTNDYPVVGNASKETAPRRSAASPSKQRDPKSGESRQTSASGARAVQRASLRPPSVGDSGTGRRVVRDVRAEAPRGSGAEPRVTTIDGASAALDWGEPVPLADFEGVVEDLRESLWRACPPAIVGCDALAGRHAAIRAAAERQALIRTRLDAKPNAGDRILLEDCRAMVDLSLRVVTQPAKWREWERRSREEGAPLGIGVFGKVRSRTRSRTTSAPRAVKASAPVSETDGLDKRVRRLKKLHPHMDEAGIQMLVASGADLFEDSASAKRVVKEPKKKNKKYTKRKKSTAPDPMAAKKAKPGFLDLPPWLSGLFKKND